MLFIWKNICRLCFGRVPNLYLLLFECCSVLLRRYEGFSLLVLPRTLCLFPRGGKQFLMNLERSVNKLDFRSKNTANSSGLGSTVGQTQGLVLQIISVPGLWNHFKLNITHLFYLIHYNQPC